ncbi:MAG: metallophosphoesterase [Pyrinomonadaceae bacterium]|nr:metallophosphoesterase [Pyrinomonadaceae bacterium]
MVKSGEKKKKFAARWQELTAAASSLQNFAASVSSTARDAFAESQTLTIERQTIFIDRLPPELDGLRVVQLSDVHHSPYTDVAQIERVVELANELKPDLAVLTGDYVSHEIEYIKPVAEILNKLKTNLGIFAVLGNHDNETSTEETLKEFAATNIKMLVNEGLRITKENASLWLGGVDDVNTGDADIAKALNGASENEIKILLCHNPAILRRAANAKIDLVVSGHTHGGQINLRSKTLDALIPTKRRASGLNRRGSTQIYISRGIGTVVLPIRYQCPPEISLLELRTTTK